MNKLQYQRLLKIRESEEYLFYLAIKHKTEDESVRDLINRLPIHHKRAWYLLSKFIDKGVYEYGVSLDTGWLVKEYDI